MRMRLLPLSAGPLSLMFDRSNAFLRYIRIGNEEFVRGIFGAVRDRDWNTIPFAMEELDIVQSSDSFHIDFMATSLDQAVAFRWTGSIEGTCDGTVHYHFYGVANAPFDRNRIGLCVLHPGECAGKKCRIEHVDGPVTEGVFPKLISPHQPFRDIRAVSHDLRSGETIRVSMTGEVFEMEDQRNWTDASYKTYGTPLDIPFPVRIATGTKIEQSVKVEFLGSGRKVASVTIEEQDHHVLEVEWTRPVRRPSLGFQWLNSNQPVAPAVFDRLCKLGPDHLRVDVWIGRFDWQQALATQFRIAQTIDASLEVAIFAENGLDSNWRDCMKFLQQPLPISRVLLFHATDKTTPTGFAADALKLLRDAHPELPIVVGTNAYFAELNRGRPVPIEHGQVCYSINPQVHAFDNDSLSETLEAQRTTVSSAVEYFGTNVVVSPVTLRPRFNPNATSTIDLAAELDAAADPRQSNGYGAAWTVGVIANLMTHPNMVSLTLFEAFGPRGVISDDGAEYPMSQPIESVLQSQWLLPCKSASPLQVVAVGTQSSHGARCVLIGNLSAEELGVQFLDPSGKVRQVRLAAESVQQIQIDEGSDA